MADKEQLRILKEKGVEAWNQWREENSDTRIDLLNAPLTGINLRNANLKNVFMRGANLSGANLSSANLSDANFRGVNLGLANLNNANLSNANLSGANLSSASLKHTNLNNANLSHVDLIEANLNNSNLVDANLCYANLRGANLINANFQDANLSHAFLGIVKALKTNFNSANFTGTCIEDWNINSQTILENISCDYTYLKREWTVRKYEFKERRPADTNIYFEPGEFAKLVEKYIETVDLIFKDGIDWQTFLTAFQELQIESESGELLVQAIERKTGEAFVVRVEVPADSHKEKIETFFWNKYNPLLEAKDREIKLLSQQTEFYSQQVEIIRTEKTELIEIVKTMAEKETSKYDLRGANIGNLADQVRDNARQQANQYNYTIRQNTEEINSLIASLREIVQRFPDEQREEAEMELNDLEEEIKTPEKQDPKRFGRRLKRLAAIGTTVATLAGGAVKLSENANTFTDNVVELGEKLEIPVEIIKDRL